LRKIQRGTRKKALLAAIKDVSRFQSHGTSEKEIFLQILGPILKGNEKGHVFKPLEFFLKKGNHPPPPGKEKMPGQQHRHWSSGKGEKHRGGCNGRVSNTESYSWREKEIRKKPGK